MVDAAQAPAGVDRLTGRLASRLLIGTAVQLGIVLGDGQEATVESHASRYAQGWAPEAVALLGGRAQGEISTSQLEVASDVLTTLAEQAAALLDLRRRAAELNELVRVQARPLPDAVNSVA